MIAKTTGYKTSDGVVCATLEEAQRHELVHVFSALDNAEFPGGVKEAGEVPKAIADLLLKQTDVVLAILALTPRSKPKARKVAGTTNPRRAAKAATPAQAKEGFAEMRAAAGEMASERLRQAVQKEEAAAA